MPNHVTNEISCKNPEVIKSLQSSEEKIVDFNNIVPMPEDMSREAVPCHIEDWAMIALGKFNLNSLRVDHGNPAESFKAGDYGSAADALNQVNMARMMTEGPFPKDFSDEEFETYLKFVKCLRKYGHANWYSWCPANWGTKWNAYEVEKINENTVRFQTAWNMPKMVVIALAEKFPEEEIRIRWADEDFGSNAGDLTIKGEEIISGGPLENESREAQDLCIELVWNGETPDYYKLENGLYVYVEEEETEEV